MKNLTLTGIILLLISALLFYFTTNFELEEIKLSHFMGVMAGIGIGLIIGGIIGYISKGSSLKAEQKKKEMLQLQKEKLEIEKQAAELAQQQSYPPVEDTQKQNPLN